MILSVITTLTIYFFVLFTSPFVYAYEFVFSASDIRDASELIDIPPAIEQSMRDFLDSQVELFEDPIQADNYRLKVETEVAGRFELTLADLKNQNNSQVYENFAVGLLNPAREYYKKLLAENPSDKALPLYHLGNINFLEFMLDEALEYYARASSESKSIEGLNATAELLFVSGNYLEAGEVFERGLEFLNHAGIRSSKIGALIYFNAALSFKAAGELGPAIKNASAAFETYRLLHNDIMSGRSANLLSKIYFELKDMDNAFDYARKALDILLDTELGAVEQEVAAALTNIGLIDSEVGYVHEAFNDFKKAITIRKRVGVGQQLSLARLYVYSAGAVMQQGFYNEAKSYYEAALELYTAEIGAEHVFLADIHSRLGGVYYFLGAPEEGLTELDNALDIYYKERGKESLAVARTMNNMGSLLYEIGDYEAAKEKFELALEIFAKNLGDTHLSVADCVANIGTVLKAQEKYSEAWVMLDKSLTLRRNGLGEYHPDLSKTLELLGEVNDKLGNSEAALDNYEEAIRINRRIFGPNSKALAEVMARAAFLMLADYPDRARIYFKEARDILVTGEMQDHPLIFVINSQLASLRELSRYEKSLDY